MIYNESCIETMARMPSDHIDLTVTSPPYDAVRSYDGLTFAQFQTIARELYRVTKPGGVVVWIVNDQVKDFNESGTSFRQALYFKEAGFNLYDTMIYHKPTTGAVGSNHAYWQAFEYMFVLSKGRPKTINLLYDTPNKSAGLLTRKKRRRQKDGQLKRVMPKITAEFRKRSNVWTTNAVFAVTDKIAYKHPATFPEALAIDHIKSWSNEGDLVYDPFMGSGTTAKMAVKLKRQYVGSEISTEYCQIIAQRLHTDLVKLTSYLE